MYSVLIMNQKTMDMYHEFQTLFSDAINSGRIGLCKWYENGTSIDTALPEIRELTDDKEEWRAIVIQVEDDNGNATYPADEKNPFDFKEYSENIPGDDDPVYESKIPLVRVSHILGGFPDYEPVYETVIEPPREEGLKPREVYRPKNCEVREGCFNKLKRKYQFDGKSPKSIILIKIRKKKPESKDTIIAPWTNHMEFESSEFWRRNLYPHSCRFMVFEKTEEGPVQSEVEFFRFWSAVALIAVNDIDAGTLQAYRLYLLDSTINHSEMEKFLQEYSDKLRLVKRSLQTQLKLEVDELVSDEEELPVDIYCDIPVVIEAPTYSDIKVSKNKIPLAAKTDSSDFNIWYSLTRSAETKLATAIKGIERTLDKTVTRARDVFEYDEEAVVPLNKYQEEDLDELVSSWYEKIVHIQGLLPDRKTRMDRKLMNASNDVEKELGTRITAPAAWITLGIVAGLLILSMVPAIIYYFVDDRGFPGVVGIALLCELAVAAICALVVLLVYKAKLNQLVKNYNAELMQLIDKLSAEAGGYRDYLSSIVSHARGKTYRAHSDKKTEFGLEEQNSKYKHITAINVLINKVKKWNKAFHLHVDFSGPLDKDKINIDSSLRGSGSKVYQFDSDKTYSVEVNDSGMSVDAPFNFVSKLIIEREELYG